MRRRNKNEEGRKKSSKRARGKGKARIAHTMRKKKLFADFAAARFIAGNWSLSGASLEKGVFLLLSLDLRQRRRRLLFSRLLLHQSSFCSRRHESLSLSLKTQIIKRPCPSKQSIVLILATTFALERG